MRKLAVFLSILVVIVALGCGGGSGGSGNPLSSSGAPDLISRMAMAEGTGSKDVRFNKVSSGLNSISLQVRISNIPEIGRAHV